MDIVENALQRGRERAAQEGVDVQLVRGDVTDLDTAGVGGGYRLILDTGTFRGLTPEQRAATGREIGSTADEDATVLMLAWEPRRRGPLPRGASLEDIERAFPGWAAAEVGSTNFEAPPPVEVLFKPAERWYRLRRRAATG